MLRLYKQTQNTGSTLPANITTMTDDLCSWLGVYIPLEIKHNPLVLIQVLNAVFLDANDKSGNTTLTYDYQSKADLGENWQPTVDQGTLAHRLCVCIEQAQKRGHCPKPKLEQEMAEMKTPKKEN